MSKRSAAGKKPFTKLGHLGRDPELYRGFVNAPAYRGSTVIFPTLDSLLADDQEFSYGRQCTPTVKEMQEALADLEGGDACFLSSSGLSAIAAVLLAFVEEGDHLLVTDSIYKPTRRYCNDVLKRLGVETTYYDPTIGADIAELLRPNTKLVFTESPGSQTFEIQDIPAIAEAAHKAGALVAMDNTWATPLFFKPFEHGVDISVHAATKYIVGHADAMLGAVIAKGDDPVERLAAIHDASGMCPGPEDVYLGLRGMRTMGVRLERHQASAIALAEWFAARPEVERVLHPAFPSCPGHELWRRDFTGASGLFSVVLNPMSKAALAAMVDDMELFGMGYSWGGFESLILPFNPTSYRSVTPWDAAGPALRIHAGLEDIDDLKADLEAGFARAAEA
ncbi:cystathionine beta-lyase [Methyloligella sp. 2.7D]|uniref:cystathionine beta-lyase n=1 Tax=unclassified Methyloligella TaxID=2625955 RepID=UPI00157D019A|nr:cystathionine beta-lyase [Methyloligella sp. GL2]QKP77559.1 cystathionine beta-lyase [Methyloligella sp. GL2]